MRSKGRQRPARQATRTGRRAAGSSYVNLAKPTYRSVRAPPWPRVYGLRCHPSNKPKRSPTTQRSAQHFPLLQFARSEAPLAASRSAHQPKERGHRPAASSIRRRMLGGSTRIFRLRATAQREAKMARVQASGVFQHDPGVVRESFAYLPPGDRKADLHPRMGFRIHGACHRLCGPRAPTTPGNPLEIEDQQARAVPEDPRTHGRAVVGVRFRAWRIPFPRARNVDRFI